MKDFFEYLTGLETYYSNPSDVNPLILKYSNDLEVRIMEKYFSDRGFNDWMNLFQRVIIRHSKKFKTLPDLTVMVECLGSEKSKVEHKAHSVYSELEHKANPYHTFITDDPACESALQSIGGWYNFCNRSVDEAPFMRKDFINAYIRAVDIGFRVSKPHVFVGIHGETPEHPKTIFIGNRETVLKSLPGKDDFETKLIERYQTAKIGEMESAAI